MTAGVVDDERKQRLAEQHLARRTEVQKQLEETIRENYDRSLTKLAKVVAPRIYMPGMLMSLEDIKKNLMLLLEPTLTTLCTGDIMTMDFSKDIKSEYYDSLIAPQLSSITYAMLCLTSDYLLGMMLYYMQKEFIFNFIMNDVVRPNIFDVVEKVRLTLNKKDAMDMEIKRSEELVDLINDVVQDIMIKLDVDAFQNNLTKLTLFDFRDKSGFIESTLNDSKYFVPDFLYTIMTNGKCTDVDIERCTQFIQRYTISHTADAVKDLFKMFLKQTSNLDNLVSTTLIERNSYQGINNLQILDGLTFVDIKIANRIINFTSTEEDKPFIEKSEVLKNIRSIVDKFHKYNTSIKLEGNDIILTDSKGESKLYNIRKEGLSKTLMDPFFLFKQADFIKHVFLSNRAKSSLYQSGVTKEEDEHSLLSMSRTSINNRSPEERVQHRNSQIQKLVQQFKHDKYIMGEYDRLTTMKIEEIKYMNPTQSKTYVMSDPGRLLLTLTETEYLYRQILKELAAQAPPEPLNKNEDI